MLGFHGRLCNFKHNIKIVLKFIDTEYAHKNYYNHGHNI